MSGFHSCLSICVCNASRLPLCDVFFYSPPCLTGIALFLEGSCIHACEDCDWFLAHSHRTAHTINNLSVDMHVTGTRCCIPYNMVCYESMMILCMSYGHWHRFNQSAASVWVAIQKSVVETPCVCVFFLSLVYGTLPSSTCTVQYQVKSHGRLLVGYVNFSLDYPYFK